MFLSNIVCCSTVDDLCCMFFSNVQYIERDGAEHFHTLKAFPDSLTKKVTLLKYFRNYMSEHLLKVCFSLLNCNTGLQGMIALT